MKNSLLLVVLLKVPWEQWTIAMNIAFILFAQFELLICESLMKVIIE